MYQHRDFECFIFLDLDGVMTPTNYIIKIHKAFINDQDINFHYRNFMQSYCFSDEAIEFLNYLYNKYTYAIVISSTRRYEFDPEQWDFLFQLNRIQAPVIGITSKILESNRREDEIQWYRKNYEIDNIPFLAIDDDIFDLTTLNAEGKLIKVSEDEGLTSYYVSQAIESIEQQRRDLYGK